jgi:hypothetical protein
VTALIRYVVRNKQNGLLAKLEAAISVPVNLSVEPLHQEGLTMLAFGELILGGMLIPIYKHFLFVGLSLVLDPS